MTHFCGSYRSDDVEMLLKPIQMAPISDLAEKERLIKTKERHYSEMLTPEKPPSPRYRLMFEQAHQANKRRMATDCLRLAKAIVDERDGHITLVSLARAGTPLGVILRHLITRLFGRSATHYSISIIRDRGIDCVALDYIRHQGHEPETIVFLDGWTGKGTIARELEDSIRLYNARCGTKIDSSLFVLADIAGAAHCAATADDYLIPFSMLNATISGLISRSVLNGTIGPGDFHGCVFYEKFAPIDMSCWFVDELIDEATAQFHFGDVPNLSPLDRAALRSVTEQFIVYVMERYGISERNYIKPGIGEATRALLRRNPDRLLLRSDVSDNTAPVRLLAKERNIPVSVEPRLPYEAVALLGMAHA